MVTSKASILTNTFPLNKYMMRKRTQQKRKIEKVVT